MIELKNVAIPSNINFLIIEDSQVMQKILSKAISDLGFTGQLNISDSLKKSQEIFIKNTIDFILLDWNLLDGTGDIFLKALRKHKKFDSLPVLMVSADDDMDRVLQCIKDEASDYLIKPPEKEEFIEKISGCWLKHHPEARISD